MKRLFWGTIAVCIAFFGCQMEEIAGNVHEGIGDGKEFHATIEDEGLTRTTLDGHNNIRWAEGDQIVIFGKSTLGLKYQIKESFVGKTSGSFSLVSSEGSEDDFNSGMDIGHNIAFYPYSESVECEMFDSAYILRVNLPAEQTYASESFGNATFPMVAVSETRNITFRNVCGGIILQLKGTCTIISIKVEGNNGEKLAGNARVTAYTDGTKPTITMDDDALTSVTLNCGEGVLLDETEATEFIISLPPTAFTKGFAVTVTDINGCTQVIETSKSNNVLRSSLLKMPPKEYIDERPVQEGDYVDEYGVNHGQGVEIDGIVWAPVNCGYKAASVNSNGFPYGKLYQWGRKYGQGYNGNIYDVNANIIGEVSEECIPIAEKGGVSVIVGNRQENSDVYYGSTSQNKYDWVDYPDNFWCFGTEDDPVKTEYDPCPDGWRVPTYSELNSLSQNYSWGVNQDGQNGQWLSGSSPCAEGAPQIFLPAAGGLFGTKGVADCRGWYGTYRSSLPLDQSYSAVLTFADGYVAMCSACRLEGDSVRCVKDDAELIPVSDLTLNEISLTLYEGDSYALSTTVTPSNANHRYARWWSDDPDVVVVDQEGKVTAVSAGRTTITAIAGMQTAVCTVTVLRVPQEGDYIDEYGISHGQGVEIDGVVWAPVNCGYHKDFYKYGKLYQWGRKYGHGYDGPVYDLDGYKIGNYSDVTSPAIEDGRVSILVGNHPDNANVFYIGLSDNMHDWITPHNYILWNVGSEDNPVKTEYDPCPDGWRVPTSTELKELRQHYSEWTINEEGQNGFWFSGTNAYTEDVPQVFFPAAGNRYYADGLAYNRGFSGNYWSSSPTSPYSSSLYFLIESVEENDTSTSRAYDISVRCVKYDGELIPVSSVILDKASLSLNEGETYSLSATIAPSDANHQVASWYSDDTEVATVDLNGNVTAVSAGSATISAIAGMQSATCIVKVTTRDEN